MQLILSEADFEKMPPELRRSLLQFVSGAERATDDAEPETVSLERTQATALLREASFHRDGKALHALLKRLAYGEEAQPPTRQLLVDALPDGGQTSLGRHLATLNRITARVVKQRAAKLWHHRRTADTYAVHPATRKALRDLLPVLARSGKAEEPLWEG
jgi:hypothetical protein